VAPRTETRVPPVTPPAARFVLLDQVPLGVCAVDSDLVVCFWNTCLAEWTGIAPSEILGKSLAVRFPHFAKARYALRLQGIFEGGPPTIFSSQLHPHLVPAPMPDGRLRIQHTVVTSIPAADGEGFEALLSIQDVTELTRRLEDQKRADQVRLEMEAHIQHAQKLESLGVLAGGIAHDFNNLLVGILGNADFVLQQLADDFSGRGNLEAVVKSAQRAADLSNQMLAYSGKGKLVILPLDLSEWVADAVDLLRLAISKKAALVCHLAEGLPAIEADPTQIRQVVMNLVTNASDALGVESGTLTLTTGTQECDSAYLTDSYLKEERPPGRYVFVDVEDTGHGMSAETQKRIFDPFFSTHVTGRGLGLAAVLGIVRGHHGVLKIHSVLGRGTKFRVLFPSSAKIIERPAAPPQIDPNWRSQETVLIADDEKVVREFAGAVLENAGIKVLTAADGEVALELYREHADEIAAVLLDMTMPKLSGEETLRAMRQVRGEVSVVLSSGYSEQEVTRRFTELGLVGFIQKPYLPQELLAKIREALTRSG
jgi:two-component system cell cycle sensor histidine kinase/response regulator CckA